ncbi:MAG TPA: hypothetical protein VFI31_13115, partial [Pirellulales bacterium]|nr:hypothetical protein [Pirellulales bacterium]
CCDGSTRWLGQKLAGADVAPETRCRPAMPRWSHYRGIAATERITSGCPLQPGFVPSHRIRSINQRMTEH